MTKKDYDLIAACLGASYKHHIDNNVATAALNDVKRRLMLELAMENPNFKMTCFYKRIQYWMEQHTGY